LDDVLFLIDCLTRFEICVDYENSPAATGLQWMPANLTAGKRQPYLYSLFKSINARTVLPCQYLQCKGKQPLFIKCLDYLKVLKF